MIRRQKGQAVLEMVLLMAVVLTCWLGAARILRDRGVFQKLFGDSWARIDNTIQFGVPTTKKAEGASNIPGSQNRIFSRLAKTYP